MAPLTEVNVVFRRSRSVIPILAAGLFLCGCVGVHEQRLVSKPNMLFSESCVLNYQPRLLVQTEPGLALSGGARAAACTSCR